jgi:hypothetical protein
VTKSDFIDWKQHPVTKEVFRKLIERINIIQETLGDSAGENPLADRFSVGAIQAYKDILLMEYDEPTEETQ